MITVNDKGLLSIGDFEIQAVAVEKGIIQWRVCDADRIRFLSFDLKRAIEWIQSELED